MRKFQLFFLVLLTVLFLLPVFGEDASCDIAPRAVPKETAQSLAFGYLSMFTGEELTYSDCKTLYDGAGSPAVYVFIYSRTGEAEPIPNIEATMLDIDMQINSLKKQAAILIEDASRSGKAKAEAARELNGKISALKVFKRSEDRYVTIWVGASTFYSPFLRWEYGLPEFVTSVNEAAMRAQESGLSWQSVKSSRVVYESAFRLYYLVSNRSEAMAIVPEDKLIQVGILTIEPTESLLERLKYRKINNEMLDRITKEWESILPQEPRMTKEAPLPIPEPSSDQTQNQRRVTEDERPFVPEPARVETKRLPVYLNHIVKIEARYESEEERERLTAALGKLHYSEDKTERRIDLEVPQHLLSELEKMGLRIKVLQKSIVYGTKPIIEEVNFSLEEAVQPEAEVYQYGSNSSNVNVADNNCTSWTYSNVTISGAPAGSVVTRHIIHYEIIHTYIGDLRVGLTDANYNIIVVTRDRIGGSADNVNETPATFTNFAGYQVNQTWRLGVMDCAAGDTGYIDTWWVQVYYNDTSSPDLTPYQPSGWSNKITVSSTTGTNTDSTIYQNQPTYIDFAWLNQGTANAGYHEGWIYVDGAYQTSYYTNSLSAGYYTTILDYAYTFTTTGNHTIQIVVDGGSDVTESNESNNTYTRTVTVSAPPTYVDLTPYQPSGWSNKIVVSSTTGTNTDSTIYQNQPTYIDFAWLNQGTGAAGYHEGWIYVDGAYQTSYYTNSLSAGYYTTILDYAYTFTTTGNHTIQIVVDGGSDVTESNESNNTYTRTVTVSAPPTSPDLTPYLPSGWSDKIVASSTSGTNVDSTIYQNQPTYLDFAWINQGTASAGYHEAWIYVDGVYQTYYYTDSLDINYYQPLLDHAYTFTTTGNHTIRIVVDGGTDVTESNESNNAYERTVSVTATTLDGENYLGGCTTTDNPKALPVYQNDQDVYDVPGYDNYDVNGNPMGICAATACGSILGYWDRTAYNGVQYWNIISNGFAPLLDLPSCADALDYGEGDIGSVIINIGTCYYTTTAQQSECMQNYTNDTLGLSFTYNQDDWMLKSVLFSNAKGEINGGRPLYLGVDNIYGNDPATGHGMPMMGYRDYSGDSADQAYVHLNTGGESSVFMNWYGGDAYKIDTDRIIKVTPGGTPQDVWDPDDSPAAAEQIYIKPDDICRYRQTHNFYQTGDVDWIKVTVQTGRVYTFETLRLGAYCDTYLYLYGTDGTTLLAQDDDGGGGYNSKIEKIFTQAGTYYIKVVEVANRSGHNTNYDLEASWVTCTAPSAPTGVTASTTRCTDVQVTWNAVTGASSYNVMRGTTCGTVVTTFTGVTSPYNDTTAVAGTAYQYWVVTVDSCGTSGNSSCASGTRLGIPSAPTGVSASTTRCTDVQVTWSSVSCATSYNVLRGTVCGTVVTTFTGVTSPYNDTTAVAGTSYQYWVVAVNTCGTSSNSACASGTRLGVTAAPTGVGASTTRCTDIQVTWSSVSGATSYNVLRGTTCGTIITTFTGVTSPYNDTTAVAGTSYQYWVVAVNACGTSSNSSCVSGMRLGVTAAPTGVGASTTRCTDVQVTWGAVSGATSYNVLRGTTCGTVVTTFTGVTSPYNDTTAVAGTSYQYWVVAVNTCGTSSNSSCAVGIRSSGPAVDVTPNGTTTVCTGSSIVFTATATGGTTPYTYQWTENGSNISGATLSTYTATKASAGSFTYNCNVTGSGCSTPAQDAMPSTGTWVAFPTSVDVTPNGTATVCTGTNIVFTATTTGGTAPYSYQWTENGTNISGATNSTYTANKAAAGSFIYNCKVASTGCATTTQDATASTGTWVAPPTSVDVAPNGTTTVCTGVNIVFTATVTGGTAPYSYQWTENGSNVSGATGFTYTANKAAAGSFTYNCKVSSTGCASTTQDATASTGTWVAPPTVDVTPNGTTTVCAGATITFTATATSGTAPYSYQWTQDGTNISGATASTYPATQGTAGSHTYNCKVSSSGCATTAQDATVSTGTWSAGPAVNVTPDGTTTVCTGLSVVFTATVTGGVAPYTYQWTESGSNISGATSSTYSVSKATAGSLAYNCKVSDSAGCNNVQDGTASTGTWVAPPTSVDVTPNGTTTVCINASITFTATIVGGATPLYQWTENGANISGATNSTCTVTKTAAGSLTYNCKVNNTGCATTVQDVTAGTGTWVAPPTVDVTPNGTTSVCTGANIVFTATATGGTAPYSYQWAENGSDIAAATTSTYTANKAAAGSFTYNCKVYSTGCTISAQDSTANTGTWIGAPTVDVTPNGTTTACTGANIVFTATATGGTAPYSYQWTENGTNISGATISTYTANKAAASSFTYNCKVSSSGCSTTGQDGTASTGTWVIAPSVDVTPNGTTTICTNVSITFTATATGGTVPYSYQWIEGAGNITGATNSTYTVTKASFGLFNYNCKVTSSGCANFGTDGTNSLGYWVAPPTSVEVTPNGTTSVCTGYGIAFTATVVGGTNLQYQWTENGTNISGAVGSTYTATKASPGTLTYNCKVRSSGCSIEVQDTTPPIGTWSAGPSVDITPNGTTSVCAGVSITYTATAAGGMTPYGYQWTENGVDISAATNSTYMVSKASVGSYTYNCKVTSPSCGSAAQDPTPSTGTWVSPPLVDVSPNGTTSVCTGTNISFTATVSGGTAPYSYQWTENGTDISAATNSTYTANKAGSGSFTYNCKVYSTGCTTPAQDATVSTGTWVGPPAVDVLPNGTTNACVNASITFTATTMGGTAPFNYQWTENGTNISSATNSTFTATKASAGTFTYNCKISSSGCSTTAQDGTASTGTWVIAPSVDVTPNGTTTICTSVSITFTATATGGTEPYSYQWIEGAGNITGATNSTYTVTKASFGLFNYNCKVTSSGCANFGTDGTNSVGYWVAPPTSVEVTPNGTTSVCTGYGIAFTATVAGGTNLLYQWTENGINISGAVGSTYTATKASPGAFTYNCKVNSSGCASTVQDATASTGTWSTGPSVDVTPNSTTTVCTGTNIVFTATASGGMTPYTYQWTENGTDISGATTSNYTATKAVAGTFAYNCKVTSPSCGTVAQDATASTGTWVAPPTFVDVTPNGTTTICTGSNITFTATSTGGITPYAYQWTVNGTDIAAATTSNYIANKAVAGAFTYNCKVYSPGCTTPTQDATASTGNWISTPAVDVTPNATTTVCAGANIVFTATATGGTAPYTYQWTENGTNISGATSSICTASKASASSCTYNCKVNSTGCATTAQDGTASTGSWVVAPTVDVTPNSTTTVCAGVNIVFTAVATGGTAPYTYQWTEDGTNISGATASTYTSNKTAAGSFTYNCRVSSSGCSTTGQDATGSSGGWVAVPSVYVAPDGTTTTCLGNSITFTATATGGTAPYSYQWTEDGSNIAGATTSNLSRAYASVQGHTYNCKITSAGCATVAQDPTASIGNWSLGPSVDVTPNGTKAVCLSANIVFTVTASGGMTPYGYQWTENGADIAGATGSTYTVIKASAGSFVYNCKVTSPGCSSATQDGVSSTGAWVPVPAAPSGLMQVATCNDVCLSWSASSYASYYEIRRTSNSDCKTALVIIGSTAGLTFCDNTGNPGTSYYYSVRAANGCSNSPFSNCIAGTRQNSPSAPSAPTYSNVTCQSLTVSWSTVSGATSYDLYRLAGGCGTGELLASSLVSSPYSDSGLASGSQYSYYLVAKNTCSSSPGTCSSITTSAGASSPGSTLRITKGASTATMDWADCSGATSYNVHENTNPRQNPVGFTTIASPTESTHNIPVAIPPSAVYWYKVVAVSGTCYTP